MIPARIRNGSHVRMKPPKLNEPNFIHRRKDVFDSPDVFATEKHPKCECNHVISALSVVIHGVQCHGNMRMTIITA